MRLPPIPPSNFSAQQRLLYDDMKEGIQKNFKGFTAIDKGGDLIGPWAPTPTYQPALAAFGEDAAAELIFLVGLYCMVSVTSNGFDVPVPE